MTDAAWLAISVMFGALVSSAGTIIIVIVNNRNKRKIDENTKTVDMVAKATITAVAAVDTKIDSLHQEINGHMHTLLEKTREAAELKGAADNQAKTDIKPQKEK